MAVTAIAGAVSWGVSSVVEAAVIGAILEGGIITAAASVIGGSVLASGIGMVAGGIASSLVRSALTSDGGGGGSASATPQASLASTQAARGLLLNAAGNIEPIPVIFGSRRVGGTRIFIGTSGSSNEYLHQVIVIGEGIIGGIDEVYLDGVASTDAKFSGLVTLEKFTGTDGQAACQTLIDAMPGGLWSVDHRLAGVAYLYVRLKYDSNVFHSLPTITADVRGRLLYDPRSGNTAFSANPALAVRDYLTNSRYGRGVPTAAIDDTTFGAEASYYEQEVSTPDGYQARYALAGVVNVDDAMIGTLTALLTSCRGVLVFSGGKFKLITDRPKDATFAFTADNIVGEWSIRPAGKREKMNRIRARFFNPARDWQPDFAIQESTTFRTQDNGIILEQDVDLPFTRDLYRAQQIAQIELKQSRVGIVCQFTATIAATEVEVGDVVTITHDTPGWTGKLFRVVGIELRQDDEIAITAREYDAGVYDQDALAAWTPPAATELPDPFSIETVTGLVVTTENITQPNGQNTVRLICDWAAIDNAFVRGYDISWQESGGPFDTATTLDNRFLIPSVVGGRQYTVRVRARSVVAGVSGAWSSPAVVTAGSPIVAPAAPTGLSYAPQLMAIELQWQFGDARLDIRGTEIWFSSSNNRAGASRLSFEPYPATRYLHPGMAPGQVGYYWLRAVDTHDNASLWSSGDTAGFYAMASTDPAGMLDLLQDAVGLDQLGGDLVAPISELTTPAGAQIFASVQSQAEAALDLLIKADTLKDRAITEKWISDATVDIDPLTGTVTLRATAEITTDVEARLNNVEVSINAIDGTVISHTDSLSAQATRITATETDITQLEGDILLKASTSYVDGEVATMLAVVDPEQIDLATQSAAEGVLNTVLAVDATIAPAIAAKARLAVAETTLQTQADALAAESVERTLLAARVDDAVAAVQTEASATADLLGNVTAKWGVKVQAVADGVHAVAGLQIMAGPDNESVFAILADKLVVYKPDGSGAPKQVIVLGEIAGVPTFGLDGDMIVDGSINARSLVANTITAESGVIANAAIQSAMIGDLEVDTIKINHGAVTNSYVASSSASFAGSLSYPATEIIRVYIDESTANDRLFITAPITFYLDSVAAGGPAALSGATGFEIYLEYSTNGGTSWSPRKTYIDRFVSDGVGQIRTITISNLIDGVAGIDAIRVAFRSATYIGVTAGGSSNQIYVMRHKK